MNNTLKNYVEFLEYTFITLCIMVSTAGSGDDRPSVFSASTPPALSVQKSERHHYFRCSQIYFFHKFRAEQFFFYLYSFLVLSRNDYFSVVPTQKCNSFFIHPLRKKCVLVFAWSSLRSSRCDLDVGTEAICCNSFYQRQYGVCRWPRRCHVPW